MKMAEYEAVRIETKDLEVEREAFISGWNLVTMLIRLTKFNESARQHQRDTG